MSKLEIVMCASEGEGVDWFDLHSGKFMGKLDEARIARISPFNNSPSFFLATESQKPAIQLRKHDELIHRSVVAEKMGPVCTSSDGSFCFSGGESGLIYVWDTRSGNILNAFQAHYKPVTALTVSCDDTFLISGGDDAIINVWSILDILDDAYKSPGRRMMKPYAEFTNHSLSVTSICVGVGRHRFVSSSADRTCILWDIPAKKPVKIFRFPSAITRCVMDPAQRTLFAAGFDSDIYQNDILSDSDVVLLKGHSKRVTDLALSFDGSVLISSSLDGTCRVWDVPSSQMLHCLKRERKSYSQVVLLTDFDGFFGGFLGPQDKHPYRPFKRNFGNNKEVASMTVETGCVSDDPIEEAEAMFGEEFVEKKWNSIFNSKENVDANTKLADALGTIEKLRAEVTQWKGLNQELYAMCARDAQAKE